MISDVLPDQVWWCSYNGFWVIGKITSANLCKSVHGIINSSTFTSPFESRNGVKEGQKLQRFEYLENEKSFLDEIKGIFQTLFFMSIRVNWVEAP